MLTAGEEPLYLLRRLTRAAVEDIGLADPQALVQCLAAKDAYDFLGSPEGELAIVQACLYLATAPKSNAAYKAQKARLAQREGDRLADAAEEHPQRADQADEADRLRQGLSIRPRRRGAASPATITGPRRWRRRPSTRRPTAASKRR